MSSTSFEPEGSSSGRRLYTRLPENESSGSKLVKYIKKNINLEKVPFVGLYRIVV
jgi:hypothetical protein